jgi:hypothetical protein
MISLCRRKNQQNWNGEDRCGEVKRKFHPRPRYQKAEPGPANEKKRLRRTASSYLLKSFVNLRFDKSCGRNLESATQRLDMFHC